MVVEDEGIVAIDIQDHLRALGYEVTDLLASGEEAQRQAEKTRPDLILMDITLRGTLDGVETAENIRKSLGIPVVFLTAHADEPTLLRAKLTEPFGYIMKPFVERELHTTIEIALHRHALEMELKRLKQWFATMLMSIGDAVIATDQTGRITFMNPIAEAITGWSGTLALGEPVRNVFRLGGLSCYSSQPDLLTLAITQGRIIDWSTETTLVAKHGSQTPINFTLAPMRDEYGQGSGVVLVFRDSTPRKQAEAERERLILELQSALAKVKILSGLLPICAECKKIRDDQGYWQQVESYIAHRSEARFTHSFCPDCIRKLYPDVASAVLKDLGKQTSQ
jgi:PAS domain S-box-containing protein